MATSRYKNFRAVKSFPTDPRRLETFPSISMNELLSITLGNMDDDRAIPILMEMY